jgi:anti-sigma regulatory factor (Ser/Thr protein kinase)
MQSLASRVDLTLPAVPDSVPKARHAAAGLAAEVGADELDVKIAVSEAVGNVVVHAYRDGKAGSFELAGSIDDGKLVFIVTDHGIGMSPHPDSPGLGFGLPLIGNVTDDLHVDADGGGGTRVSMTFLLSELDY